MKEEGSEMSVSAVLVRFTIAYMVLMVVLGMSVAYLGIESSSGINMGVLFASVFWVCGAFAKNNRRYFTGSEKFRVILGFIVIDILLQSVFSAAAASGQGGDVNVPSIFTAALVVGLIHGILIYFLVGVAGKMAAKQAVIKS